ncbi:putative bifunctional diguanylate cyclase/phosphodiesterase [Cohnella nanjingensis]|uniref:putative bifunctional diguanylate cyclase/phosphodiesterase n=1 Tax=Cohnella nanjingensis TaxID=1387779 RepID=UPI0028AA7D80|nr:EAL domain-containing protein [Cohnella nanjingensis]
MNGWHIDGLWPAWIAASGIWALSTASLGWFLARERRKSKAAKRSHDAELLALLEESPLFFAVIDREGSFERMNRDPMTTIGRPKEQLIGRSLLELLAENSRGQGMQIFRKTLQGERCTADVQVMHAAGHPIDLNIETAPLVREGRIEGIVVFTQDISERRRSLERIRYMAYYDDMTGLPNRRFFMNRLQERLSEPNPGSPSIAVFYLDVDRFKLVNASYGRDTGDILLLQIAERLTRCFDIQEDLARMEGDEFVGMFVVNDAEEAAARIGAVLRQFDEPFELGGIPLHVTVSVGLSLNVEAGDDAGMLIKKADTALHRVKENGRNGYTLYKSEFENTALHKLTLQHELIEALHLKQFMLYYQPQYDLVDGRIVGLEALIRWRHPERGLVPPIAFIPAAEDSGMIVALGDWVLREACRQNRAWQDAGLPPIPVSVNLSFRQFAQMDLVGKVAAILEETGLEPRYLKLEITESMTMDVERALSYLKALTALGVGISVDDFGTGYSSFHYLKRLPIGSLKIDRSFVRDIQQDPNDRAIVAAIIAMAHNLQLQVIAEGVENEEQVRFLQHHRCDEMQGYYGSPPVPSEAVENLLALGRVETLQTISTHPV